MIEFKNVYYKSNTHNGAFSILEDISVKIDRGRLCCIIGRNGSGKTTFGKLVKGLITPASGEVIVNNKVNTGVNDSVGYIFTNPENQIVHPIVEDDIAFGLENIMVDEERIAGRIERALKDVKMERCIKSQIHWLSKGEQQKIVAAGVIVMENDVIIFDEATAMLDGITRDEFMGIVLNLNKKDKKTVIFITNDLEDVMYADDVLLLDNGRLIFFGEKSEFFMNGSLKEKYEIEFPDIVELINHYSAAGYDLGRDYKDLKSIARKISGIKGK